MNPVRIAFCLALASGLPATAATKTRPARPAPPPPTAAAQMTPAVLRSLPEPPARPEPQKAGVGKDAVQLPKAGSHA